jgi:hypothetical protein
MHDARRIDDVERAFLQSRPLQIHLDELHASQAESLRRGGAESEGRTRQIGADNHAIAARG